MVAESGRTCNGADVPAEKRVVVLNERGLHLSSAAKIAKTAQKFSSRITLVKGNKKANAKSVLNITGLMAPCGTELKVIAEGEDQEHAVAALETLFNNRFEEDK